MSFKKMSIDSLVAKAETLNETKKYQKDERFWKPTVDKSGNGFAVIRFLPPVDSEDTPWVRFWDHGFKGPTGQWYIEKSLTSIGQNDPVSESNTQLWNSGRDEDKQIVRNRKRRLRYVSNIYVVSDPANPETEGKVFLFQYGKAIHDKILDKIKPEFADEEPVNPFDVWEGCDFKVKIRHSDGYRNYDKSEFALPSVLVNGDEDKLEEISNAMSPLYEFVDPKNYKTYDELKARLDLVLGTSSAPRDERMPQAPSPLDRQGGNHYDNTTEGMFTDDEVGIDPAGETHHRASNVNTDDTLSYFAKLASQD